ncbi:inositol polyphosphate 5-phosphatase E isoform X2 [Nasonia vitripennis]|uniref:Inositol polyphosphate-related phosphatase domain-containing protein n=1 Tax=Nasonia vitripennis TaxID=7425 RepID=A0A7M7R2C5_NASVI|nr:inositol polyphosphate 5-phosphatase E isoform X2 [Nasonia vitripennis]
MKSVKNFKFNNTLRSNFLHGRLGTDWSSELIKLNNLIPDKRLNVFIGTWNMNARKPVVDLSDFILPKNIQNRADILIIGTQETYFCSTNKWEYIVQNTLGPDFNFVMKESLGTLQLVLFMRCELSKFISFIKSETLLNNRYKILKTKGAIAIAIIIFGTSFLFITTHLTPHTKNIDKRFMEIEKLVKWINCMNRLLNRKKNDDDISDFDNVFLFGDLNFRIDESRNDVIKWIEKTHFGRKIPVAVKEDQLNCLLNSKTHLHSFNEAPITFPPTYKYDPKSQVIDSSNKLRIPSYTDRILYKSRNQSKGTDNDNEIYSHQCIKCLAYDSARSICLSDHKPVYGMFAVEVRGIIYTK